MSQRFVWLIHGKLFLSIMLTGSTRHKTIVFALIALIAIGLFGIQVVTTNNDRHGNPHEPGDDVADQEPKKIRGRPNVLRKPEAFARPNEGIDHVTAGALTVDEFQEEWTLITHSQRSSRDQTTLLAQLVARFSRQGQTEEAARQIMEEFGPGSERSRLLRTCIFSAVDISALESTYSLLEFKDEREAAQKGIASFIAKQIADEGSDFRFDRISFEFLGDSAEDVASLSAIAYLDIISRTNPKDVGESLQSVLSDESVHANRLKIIEATAQIAPFESWMAFSKLENGEFEAAGNLIVSKMMERDPNQTISVLAQSNNSESYFPGAFLEWMKKDVTAPVDYLASDASQLSEAQYDHAISGIVMYSCTVGELDAAESWGDRIQDQNLRKAVLQELSILRKASEKN